MIWKRKATDKIKLFLRQGVTPEKLALSLSFGITVGIIPLYGLTSLLITLVALGFRLNFAITHAVHYVVHPLQIALIIPFLKLGKIFYGESLFPYSIKKIIYMLNTDLWGTLNDFWTAYLSAFFIWLIISVPLFLLLYRMLLIALRKYSLSIAK